MPERLPPGSAQGGPCACARLVGRGEDPDRLVLSGNMIREVRHVHQEPRCSEDVLVCTGCGTRFWVVGDDGHWSGTQYTWSTSRPLI